MPLPEPPAEQFAVLDPTRPEAPKSGPTEPAAAGLDPVMIVTAVPAERDAVVSAVRDAALAEAPGERPHENSGFEGSGPGANSGSAAGSCPGADSVLDVSGGYQLHRVRFGGGPPLTVDTLAAGVGAGAAAAGTATVLTTAALAGRPYGLVVSAGICGGFLPDDGTADFGAPNSGTAGASTGDSSTSELGTPEFGTRELGTESRSHVVPTLGGTVLATAIVAADLGAQTPYGFASVAELGFGTVEHRPPARLARTAAEATGAATGPVLTVSTVTGTAQRAEELAARHPGAVGEAMEGFGVAEAAAAHGVPTLELRTVSNRVGPRDREAWRIPDALAALGGSCTALVPVLRAWAA